MANQERRERKYVPVIVRFDAEGNMRPVLIEFDDSRKYTIDKIRTAHPDYIIDGEMQLDAAIDPAVSAKKFPASAVKGQANVLITPDLNSGNILYKALERFAGFTVAGPIIQGFQIPLADLSRGSTADDIKLTIEVIRSLL